jgi:hypothetical protein
MTYTSIQQIKFDFDINADDINLIRDALKEIKNQAHPNSTQGDFKNEAQKDKYHRVNSAIDFVNRFKNNDQLVVVEKMTDLMKVVLSEMIPSNKQTSLEQNLENRITIAIDNYRSKSFFPKVSLTAVTGILTFIFLFPSQIKDNPTLTHFINPQSSIFLVLWFSLLLYTLLFWWMTYTNDENSKQRLSLLKVDSTQNELFLVFIRQTENKIFSKDELTQYIFNISYGRNDRPLSSFFLGSEIINLEIAQNTAEVILNRAEKKNVIKKLPDNGLSDSYEFNG